MRPFRISRGPLVALALLASGCFWRHSEKPPVYELEPVEAVVTPLDRGPGVYHVLKPGETFYRLSRIYGVPVEAIQKANPALDPRKLVIGTEIFIPGATEKRAQARTGGLPPREGAFWRPVRGRVLVHFGGRTPAGRSEGVDLAAARNEAVLASEAGRVTVAAGSLLSLGPTVILEHAGGFSTLYGGMGSIRVKPGQVVSRGEVLGAAGGGRVHFRIYKGTAVLDPRKYVRLR